MGTKLSTRGALVPRVNVTNKESELFIGRYINKRQFDSPHKDNDGVPKKVNVYLFEVLDTTMPVGHTEKKEFVEDEVKVGSKVEILGGTRLSFALDQVTAGQVVRIVYLGEGERPKKGGNRPNEYEVTLLTQEEVNALN